MMRRILVDRARARQAGKRSGTFLSVVLDEGMAQSSPPSCDVPALDHALRALGELDPQPARLGEVYKAQNRLPPPVSESLLRWPTARAARRHCGLILY
jgi:hypothetical protein